MRKIILSLGMTAALLLGGVAVALPAHADTSWTCKGCD